MMQQQHQHQHHHHHSNTSSNNSASASNHQQPHQQKSHQSLGDVHSILSLPPELLAALARTSNLQQHVHLCQQKTNSTLYLESLILEPPPQPSSAVLAQHPPSSHLPAFLEQIWAPLTCGIVAPDHRNQNNNSLTSNVATNTSSNINNRQLNTGPFGAIYSESLDKWAREQAAQNVTNPADMEHITTQLKSWAAEMQTDTVRKEVIGAREQAVNLAASVQAKISNLDISGYKEAYRKELVQLASDYYPLLHQESLRRLDRNSNDSNTSVPPPPNPPPSSSLPGVNNNNNSNQNNNDATAVKGLRVQASAVAAISANVIAAQTIVDQAGRTLSTMGYDASDMTAPLPTTLSSITNLRPTTKSHHYGQHQQQSSYPHHPHHQSSSHSHFGLTSASSNVSNKPASSSISSPVKSSTTTTSPSSHHQHHQHHHHHNQHHQHHHSQQQYQAPHQLPPNLAHALTSVQNSQSDAGTRDLLLSYAHQLYASTPESTELLPLLNTLHSCHPNHTPTILLLACVHLSLGSRSNPVNHHHLQLAYQYNESILGIDPNHVEAMSNIGTTLRALGRQKEAEAWWKRAISLRPTYFDGIDTLLQSLSTPLSSGGQPRTKDALDLCTSVENAIFISHPNDSLPLSLPSSVPFSSAHRLLSLFFAKGNLNTSLGNALEAKKDYEKGTELALSVPGLALPNFQNCRYSLHDLVIAATIAGLFLQRLNAGYDPSQDHPGVKEFVKLCGGYFISDQGHTTVDILQTVSKYRPQLEKALLNPDNTLPFVLLQPDSLPHLTALIFGGSNSSLPIIGYAEGHELNTENARSHINAATSTLLVTLSKVFQDILASPDLAQQFSVGSITPSASLVLPLYYVAISIHQSASTFNNLGILLSTLNCSIHILDNNTVKEFNGQTLAMLYYAAGLRLDSTHPHLYTNLGSLYKDMGNLQGAVQMYKDAVNYNPNFDIALANLANAIKDMGQVQESIQWYQRAVQINPNFPEAVCGLVNALGGICNWRGRGSVDHDPGVDNDGYLIASGLNSNNLPTHGGWMQRIRQLVQQQLDTGALYGVGVFKNTGNLQYWVELLNMHAWLVYNTSQNSASNTNLFNIWQNRINYFLQGSSSSKDNEGGVIIRMIEMAIRMIQRQWYLQAYGRIVNSTDPNRFHKISPSSQDSAHYRRPLLPATLPPPSIPTVLPFHTFTYPLSGRDIRLISHRNALRLSYTTLNQPWLPTHVYPPPPPPVNKLNIGYVSSDFNNHPLAHLMQSVFGFHNPDQFNVFCYATAPATANDKYREKIQREAKVFRDVSTWPTQNVVHQILQDEIHILINLNGYTKGAKNEIFAARPCPVTAQFMGFCGTLGAGWNDWLVSDTIATPPELVASEKWRERKQRGTAEKPTDIEGHVDPEDPSSSWVYTEKVVYMPHTYFINDHKQGFREPEVTSNFSSTNSTVPDNSSHNTQHLSDDDKWTQEEQRRWLIRKEIFPNIPDDTVIFANFNQLYKIDPLVFKLWLEILRDVPNSILWLLRFPAAGEEHLKETAHKWAGPQVASRVFFTDVCDKSLHILRGRVADVFLDCTECNSHTTASDILWSGTPILTWPRYKYKMCSRVAASVANATGYGHEMTVKSYQEYYNRAVHLGKTLKYVQDVQPVQNQPYNPASTKPIWRATGEAADLRKKLFLSRESSALFDTKAWVRNLENSYWEMWKRWVDGTVFENSADFTASNDERAKKSGCIWINDMGHIIDAPPPKSSHLYHNNHHSQHQQQY